MIKAAVATVIVNVRMLFPIYSRNNLEMTANARSEDAFPGGGR
ncbi:hypothetical protein [Novosphingobium sp. Fuku2-ISO-50]|nr:hypothetical protein [Novosphingobium sp. Fuku2-ISO-50]